MDYNNMKKSELIRELKLSQNDVKNMGRRFANEKERSNNNYSKNALEIAHDKIKELKTDLEITWNYKEELILEIAKLQKNNIELNRLLKIKNQTIIHLAEVQAEMEKG